MFPKVHTSNPVSMNTDSVRHISDKITDKIKAAHHHSLSFFSCDFFKETISIQFSSQETQTTAK